MKKAKTLSKSQISNLFAITKEGNNGLRNTAILTLSFFSGLRAKELASLKIGDVLNKDKKIKPEMELVKEYTKGDKHRTIYLSNTKVLKILTEYFKSLDHLEPNQPLFKSQKGFHFSANAMVRLMKNLFKKGGAEYEGCSSHSGRRNMITTLVNNGVSLNKVKEISGHSNISTTIQYVDTNPIDLSNIMKGL